MTLPAPEASRGTVHPVSQVMDELAEIFADLGFAVADGSRDRGRMAQFHRAQHAREPSGAGDARHFLPRSRDDGESEPQRAAHPHLAGADPHDGGARPPIRIIAPGRVYRSDSDATHTPMFHQVEGLVIDRGDHARPSQMDARDLPQGLFRARRHRAAHAPELFPVHRAVGRGRRRLVDGEGPPRASAVSEGWMEVLGSGMVHPRVIANCGLDPDEWQGFAFGCGIDRLAMLKYGMDDLRAFFDGDIRWLRHYGFRALDVPTLSGGVGRMKFTLSWLKEHLETREPRLDDDRRQADRDRPRGRRRRAIPAETLAPFRVAEVLTAEQASAGRQAAGADRRCRRRRPVQVVCGAPNARAGHGRRVRPAGRLRAGQRHDAEGRGDPRGRKPRHDVLGARARARRRP